MYWSPPVILAALAALFVLLRHSGRISLKRAQQHLKNGALLIDVRTAGEFVSRHLPSAINLPLNEIETSLPRQVRDRSQVLLVHCQSGLRSGIAKKKMNALGYLNVFNLGTYARAARLLNRR